MWEVIVGVEGNFWRGVGVVLVWPVVASFFCL